jgi:hypothetical protein
MVLTSGETAHLQKRVNDLRRLIENHILLMKTLLLPIAREALRPPAATVTGMHVSPDDSREVSEDAETAAQIEKMRQAEQALTWFHRHKTTMRWRATDVWSLDEFSDWKYSDVSRRTLMWRKHAVEICQQGCRDLYDRLIEHLDPSSTVKEEQSILREYLDDDRTDALAFMRRVRI